MKIALVGTRGIPAKYGGFETFAEEISSRLVKNGYDVSVQCDNNSYYKDTFNGIKLIFSTVTKSDHPLKYYFEGFRWGMKNSDVILAASAAGSIFYFLNIFKGIPVITNPDGLEYYRQKWSPLKKMYLKISEVLAIRLSDYIVADSEEIKKHLCLSYRHAERKIRVIEYGTSINDEKDFEVIKKYNINHYDYYLVVSRLEPENNLHVIIDGFMKARTDSLLVIVGNLIDNQYVRSLTSKNYSERVRFLGGIYDKRELNPIRFSCKAYIHGHSVGGTNPSLLEAMGSRNIILTHDNKFNREVTANSQFYFSNANQVKEGINCIEQLGKDEIEKYKESSLKMIIGKYNWDNILKKYMDFFREINLDSR